MFSDATIDEDRMRPDIIWDWIEIFGCDEQKRLFFQQRRAINQRRANAIDETMRAGE